MVFKVNGCSHRPGCSDIQCPFPQAELILNGGKKVRVEYRRWPIYHGLEYKHEHGRLGYNQMVVINSSLESCNSIGRGPFSAKINILIKWLDLVPVQIHLRCDY